MKQASFNRRIDIVKRDTNNMFDRPALGDDLGCCPSGPVFDGLFPRPVGHIATETNMLSKSSTLTRAMTRTSCTDGSLSASLIVQTTVWAGKSMLLIQNKRISFLPASDLRARRQVLLFLDQIKREKGVW
eukprot:TRINITY_DN565_c0_g1_i7.p2 TRINITY_DN565_c0_g1~~TRINITY_DN565_c0_g1_i7.p2  ORF type:complete len:130 (-),score=6.82 TRINITY_DN565_c0_g1_i7:262-651(-)